MIDTTSKEGQKIAGSAPSPPAFHLCQPDLRKSCVWCCGLYNICNVSRETLVSALRLRTEEFARTERTVAAILNFSEKTKQREQFRLLDPEFYACEYVGFLDEGETRVGCLLHPSARGNEGTDWRGLSFHGAMACQGFFCRAHRELSGDETRLILETINDWFLFGLVISDVDFIKYFFHSIKDRLEPCANHEKLVNPSALKVVREFFEFHFYPRANTAEQDMNRILFLLSKRV